MQGVKKNIDKGFRYCACCGGELDDDNYRNGRQPICADCREKQLDKLATTARRL